MKRKNLIVYFSIATMAGVIFATYPLIVSMNPSIDKVSKKISVNINEITPGEFVEVNVKNLPVIIFRPNKEFIEELVYLNTKVNGPKLKVGEIPSVFVYGRISTFKGCVLQKRDKVYFGDESKKIGGWVDLCHHGAWDYAGRSLIGDYPKLPNLESTKYRIKEDVLEFYEQ